MRYWKWWLLFCELEDDISVKTEKAGLGSLWRLRVCVRWLQKRKRNGEGPVCFLEEKGGLVLGEGESFDGFGREPAEGFLVFCLFSKARGSSREDEMAQGKRSQLRGIWFFLSREGASRPSMEKIRLFRVLFSFFFFSPLFEIGRAHV